jgi:hypothetical protein
VRELAVAVVFLLGCGGDDPLSAVEQFQRAAEAGARADVFALLGPATKARLEADAHKAADLSGRRNVRPEELLAIGWSPRRFRTVELRLLGRSDDHAEVEADGEHGEREVLQLVKSEGRWRIELP